MRIGSGRFVLVVALAAALLPASVASGQNGSAASGDWAAVSAAGSGGKLVVKLKDGRGVEGRLGGVTDSALSLSVKGKPVDLRREDVQRVYAVRGKSATKATLIGMGVGAGAGAVVGAAGSSADDGFDKLDKAVTAGLTVIGAGIGAATGYLIGRGSKRVLIYDAGRP